MRRGRLDAAACAAPRPFGGGAGRLLPVLRRGLLSVCVGWLAGGGGCALLEPDAGAKPDRLDTASGGRTAAAGAEDSSSRTVWIESTPRAESRRSEATPKVSFCAAAATVRFVAPSAGAGGGPAADGPQAATASPQQSSSGDCDHGGSDSQGNADSAELQRPPNSLPAGLPETVRGARPLEPGSADLGGPQRQAAAWVERGGQEPALRAEQRSGNPPEEIPLPEVSAGKSAAVVELKPIAALGTDIQPHVGDLPQDHASGMFAGRGTLPYRRESVLSGDEVPVFLASADFCHHPLYFEQFNLERYGYHHGLLQPLVSGAMFFGTLPALPYLAAVDHPRQYVSTAGPYGPGQFGPCRHVLPPWNFRAALFEAGLVTGLVFVIP